MSNRTRDLLILVKAKKNDNRSECLLEMNSNKLSDVFRSSIFQIFSTAILKVEKAMLLMQPQSGDAYGT